MGYRSEIVLAIKGEIAPEIIEALEAMFDQSRFCDQGSVFHGSWIKWDDSIEEVKLIMDWLDERPDNYYMLRLGEELGDVEYLGDWFDNPFQIGYEIRAVFDLPN